MLKVYVARHGETTWNEEGRIQGRSDPGLSDRGYAQSLALCQHLRGRPLSAIYTSTLKRSVHTAEPLANLLGLPILTTPELDEIAFGVLEGKRLHELDEELRREWEQFKDHRFTYRIPGAENYSDVRGRVKPFVERILQVHRGQEILIVGHRVVNRLLIGTLMGYPEEIILRIEQTNEMVYLIEKNARAKIYHWIDGEMRDGVVLVG